MEPSGTWWISVDWSGTITQSQEVSAAFSIRSPSAVSAKYIRIFRIPTDPQRLYSANFDKTLGNFIASEEWRKRWFE